MAVDSSRPDHTGVSRWATWTCIIIELLIDLGAQLIQLPLLRVCELGFCQRYYAIRDPSLIDASGNVDEQLCKIGSVQDEVAFMMGVLGMVQSTCGTERD